MANRKLAFGYEMQRGIVCVKTAEAAIVKEIYAAYIRGISYSQITDSLNAQAVPYNEPGKSWNKNMVARVLSNELYTGNETYPVISVLWVIPGCGQRKTRYRGFARQMGKNDPAARPVRCLWKRTGTQRQQIWVGQMELPLLQCLIRRRGHA